MEERSADADVQTSHLEFQPVAALRVGEIDILL